jgi:hypothetical protein
LVPISGTSPHGEAVRERDRQHAVLAFQRLHALSTKPRAGSREVWNVHDHLAVDHRGHGPDLAE